MEINDFYSFGSKLVSSTVQVHENILNKDKTNNIIYGQYDSISFPVIFKQEYGKKWEDILDTGWVSLFLISDKMKSVLEENALTGWKTFAVKVLDKKDLEIQGYHGLSITGRCGKIDYGKSRIIEKRLVPNGPLGKYYKGLHVGLDKWDGCDFFLPEKYFGIIITSRASEVLKKNKLTNIRLENLTEIEIPDFALPKE